MDATLGCGRPQKRPQKRPQLEILEIFLVWTVMARAVKGGEAEAPDVSAPSLEGLGTHPRSQWRWPAGHRPAWMPIFCLATRSLRRLEGAGGPGAVGTGGACVCIEFRGSIQLAEGPHWRFDGTIGWL